MVTDTKLRINHNIPAMNAHRLLNKNNTVGSKTLEKLSSGKRINRAGDDAAGMAISEKMRAQIRGLQVASRNSLDGVSLVQTAEGAMNEVHSMLQRMRELSVQAANGTSAESDRLAIQDEINQLTSEVNRISNGTEYNTRTILKGNEGPDSNTLVHSMSTGKPAQTTGNVDVASKTPPAFDLKAESLSIFIDGKEKVVNLTQTNESTTLDNFMDLVNDALGKSANAVIDKDGQIEITTASVGGLSTVEIKGSAESLKMFYPSATSLNMTGVDIKGINSVTSTATANGVTSETDIAIGGGSIKIGFKANESAFAEDISIKFTEGATAGAVWSGNKLTVTLDKTNNNYSDTAIQSLIQNASGTVPPGIDKDSFTVVKTGTIDLSTVDLSEPLQSLPEATLASGVSAKDKVTLAGVDLNIYPGAVNANKGPFEIVFTEGATAGAAWSGSKLTVTLYEAETDYDPASIELLIKNATKEASPAVSFGLDMNAFHVEGGAGDINLTTVDLVNSVEGTPLALTLTGGDTGVGAKWNSNINGTPIVIDAGVDNDALGNINIVFIEDSAVNAIGDETTAWDETEKTLTINLAKNKTYNQAELLTAIQQAGALTNGPDTTHFTVTLATTIDLSGTVNLTQSIGGPVTATLPKAVGAEANLVAAGLDLTISAGFENGELGNADIKFVEGATADEGAVWSGNTLTVTLDKSKTDYTANDIQTIIRAATNNPYPNSLTGQYLDMSKFTVTGSPVGTPISATLNKAAAAETTVSIAGTELKVSAGAYNGALGNDVTVKFTQGATAGAAWSGNTLTVTLDEKELDYDISDIEKIIQAATTDKPADLDMSKFTVKSNIDTSESSVKAILTATGTAENATRTSTGTFYFDAVPEVGSRIQIGNEIVEFFDSSLAPYIGSNRPIDIAGKDTAEAIVDEIVNKFGSGGIDGVNLKKDPKFSSQVDVNGDSLPAILDTTDPNYKAASQNSRLIIEAKEIGFNGNLIYLEGTPDDFTTNLQVGANSGQGFRLEIGDIRSQALKISGDNPTRNPGVKGASYVNVANVTDGISSSMVEYAVDVTTEEKASAAITVFDNAIVQIAKERSKLGATQNRLEHTIANLDNTAENLTAALSRIEDTDMALEMSEFQKMNVLQQAGVSMLAQANQQPQNILKLLG